MRAAKGGDPLAPVAVIVPTNTAGVMARRALGRRGGAAAIDVLTLYRVAELLGAPSLHAEGRNPVSTPVVDLAVKQVIHDTPGLYAGVNHHPSTVVALRDLYRELRVAGPGVADRAGPHGPRRRAGAGRRRGRPPPGPAVVRRGRPAGPGRRPGPPRPARPGSRRVVVHLPQRLRPLEHRLLAALGRARPTSTSCSASPATPRPTPPVAAIAEGLAGHPRPGRRRRRRPRRRAASRSSPPPTPTTRCASPCAPSSTPPGAGTPFDRIAVLFPTDRPYARLVEHQLDAGRHPVERPPGHDRRRADGAAGAHRAARARPPRPAPHVADDAARRRARPARPDGRAVPDGPVGAHRPGRRRRPRRRLGRRTSRATPPSARAERGTPRPTPRRPTSCWRSSTELRGALGDPAEVRPWADVGRVVEGAPRALVRAARPRPPRRRRARRRGSRRGGSSTGSTTSTPSAGRSPAPSSGPRSSPSSTSRRPARARSATASTSARWPARPGSTSTSSSSLGAADGLLPPPPVVDPLLGDHERAGRRPGGLRRAGRRGPPPVPRRRRDARRPRSSPCPAATCGRRPTRHPSRWVDRARRRRAGRSVATRSVDSHAHGLAQTEFPVSAAEHRVRELWTARPRRRRRPRPSGSAADDRRAAPGARAARRPGRRRRSPSTTATCPAGAPFADRPGRVADPHRDVGAAARTPTSCSTSSASARSTSPTTIETLSPLDRGSAIHDAIDRLQHGRRSTADRRRPGPTAGPTCTPPRCAGPARQVADELHAAGRTGPHGVLGQRAGRPAAPSSTGWLAFDAARRGRAARSACPSSASATTSPSSSPCPDGRTIAVPRADRPRRRAARRHARRHRPQDGQARRPRQAVAPTIRRSAAPASSCPVYAAAARAAARPARRPGARRVHVLQARLQARRR